MSLLSCSCVFNVLKLYSYRVSIPITTQLRWKKEPKRKPKWLPMAPSKVFRIPVHPYVAPEEQDLIEELLDEYYRKVDSMRKLFQEELKQKSKDDGTVMDRKTEEEQKFCLLLEENKKENEQVGIVREEILEKLFQEQQIELLQLEEERKIKEQETKLRVDEIVRKQKEIAIITHENLESAIEKAIDNPININFAITVNGEIKWEAKPPVNFEEELKRKMLHSSQS